jgi:hypothetical protein
MPHTWQKKTGREQIPRRLQIKKGFSLWKEKPQKPAKYMDGVMRG